MRTLIAIGVAAACLGCQEGLYHDLDERSANEVVAALHQAGIEASKVGGQRGWTVQIPRGSTTVAMHALRQRGLPRPTVSGFAEVYPTDALVQSPQEQQALYQHATAQEVRRALLTVDGVVDAHVNVVLPPERRPGAKPPLPPRASVVIRHNGGDAPPVSREAAAKLVANSVAALSAERVEVLLSPIAAHEAEPELDLVNVGPLTVPAPQKSATQLVLATLLSGILVLALMLVAFVRGGRRA